MIGRIRTDTIRVHGPGLCWLSYDHHRTGCPGRLRTSSRRVNSAPLHRLSYWTTSVGEARETRTPTARFWRPALCRVELAPRRNWYRPTDSNRAPLAYRASALPAELDRHGRGAWIRTRDLSLQRRAFCWLNYAPTEWCFPSVSSGALRGFNPALSPDQLEKRGDSAEGGRAQPWPGSLAIASPVRRTKRTRGPTWGARRGTPRWLGSS